MQARLNQVCAVLLLATIAWGASQLVRASLTPGGLDFPRTSTDFWNGKLTHALEKQLDKKLPARDALIAGSNALRYRLFQGGGDQVRVGKDGWLFITDEIKYEGRRTFASKDEGQALLNQRLDLLASASQALDARGVKLVVALVPDKARVYAKQLDGGYPSFNASRYPDALAGLQQRKVAVADVLVPMQAAVAVTNAPDIYYRTDTHWNQAGAKIAAQAIAQTVRGLNLGLDATSFSTQASGPAQERSGDLIRLMGLEGLPAAFRPATDTEAPQTTSATSATGAAAGGGGLFGDAGVPVTLIGTSYSMRGNFHGHMQEALSAKVLNTAKDGGGFLQAATAYFKDDSFKQSKPKLLVWELPERMLRAPLDGEGDWLKRVGFTP